MQFSQGMESSRARIELIPLLDVLFLLLIFFFYSIFHLVDQKGLPVDLVEISSAKSQDRAEILLVINTKGEIFLESERITLAEIQQRFKSLKEEDDVLIRADHQAPVGQALKILDYARVAGLKNIAFALENPPWIRTPKSPIS